MKIEEIRKLSHVSVKNPLPICQHCAKLKVKIPGSQTDFAKKRKEVAAKRKKALETAVSMGRKRKRNNNN